MGSRATLAGVEVPFIATDSVKWIELSVPPLDGRGDGDDGVAVSLTSATSTTEDGCASSCSVIGVEPPQYFIWKIHQKQPCILELLQLSASHSAVTGLRITFPHSLSPFSDICHNHNEISGSSAAYPYLLYALSVSGVAYRFQLKNLSSYSSISVFPSVDFVRFNLQSYYSSSNAAPASQIISVTAAAGCLVVGRRDGYVSYFQLGSLNPSAPGFAHELRDDLGIGRLWSYVSRGRSVGAVQDLGIAKMHGLLLLSVLHSDGVLRVWDMSSRSRILSHTLGILNSEGATFAKLWVGEVNEDSCIIPLAILHTHTLETRLEVINVCHLHCTFGDRIIASVESSMQTIPLDEGQGECIDVKLTADKIWILKDNGLVLHNLLHASADGEDAHFYALQEEFVAEQLFQSSEVSADDLLWFTHSIFSSKKAGDRHCVPCPLYWSADIYNLFRSTIAKFPFYILRSLVFILRNRENLTRSRLYLLGMLACIDMANLIGLENKTLRDQIVPFVSSIFLRRLLQPGVYHSSILRSTLLDYNRYWSDAEFQSLTVEGLKKEIRSLIEHEGFRESPVSIFCNWKNFCARYVQYWCKNNCPCGLLVQSSAGVIGLVRRNSISLFRDMENIEMIADGSSEGLLDLVSFGLGGSIHESDRDVLIEVLRCTISVSLQLGKSASAIFYELHAGTPIISSEEVAPRLLKILETGYSLSILPLQISDVGGDFAWEKELADHKSLRKFSVDMLLSLHALSKKAASWGNILDVIERYLNFLTPQKCAQKLVADVLFNVNTNVMIHATSQIAMVMFESTLDILLFLGYLQNISGQINMLHSDISRIQLELVPMIQETVSEWLVIHFLCIEPSESPPIEDFSYQLSSLRIDNNADKRSWNEKLGKCDFTLAFILLLTCQASSGNPSHSSSRGFPNPQDIVSSVREFTSSVVFGEGSSFLRRSNELASILLRHGQYHAVEYLLTIVEANSRREKVSRSIQDSDGNWCVLHHLLGFCLLAQSQCGLHGALKEKKVCEAIRSFFRASSGKGASQALQDLCRDAGLPELGFDGCTSPAVWKLHYFQWAMQIFEQYNVNEGASQFALAALEQVDEALSGKDDSSGENIMNESETTVKGRLWANVFKFTLDLNHLYDAYCAILSNPDEESKYICLRRFIIVLFERGAMKVLCDGRLPFIGLAEKIEQELAWKAERSDILAKPNPYKLLYAFEMHRHNWRKAATYMYQYSSRLRTEIVLNDHQHISLVLQERLNGLSAAINALLLVHPAYAWIDPLVDRSFLGSENYPSKKAKKSAQEQLAGSVAQSQLLFYVDVEKLENEFVLTSAEHLLSLANVRWTFTGTGKPSSELVDLLVQRNLYDMAFTILIKFWMDSGLKRELEKVFSAMSLKCCPDKAGSSYAGMHGLLLTSGTEGMNADRLTDACTTSLQSKGNSQWETLELYLIKYKAFHAGLPVTVAETLLRTDPHIELPLWLVHMFKDVRRERTWGMSGQESSPSSLFQLYVNYGRYMEATNMLLEYTESFASVRPSDLINRKKPFAVWFPYTTIERLWCQLEECIKLGHMVDQCEKLKTLLQGALTRHVKLLKVDSEDALASATC